MSLEPISNATPLPNDTDLVVPGLSRTIGRVVALALGLFGIEIWLNLGNSAFGRNFMLETLGVILLLSLIPPIHRKAYAILLRMRQPSPRAVALIAVGVFIVASVYLPFTAARQGRTLQPRIHDEFSYLLQMRLFAAGHLTLPAVHTHEFFDSFNIFVMPVYASAYFPGTALMWTPADWLHLPVWMAPVLTTGVFLALLYVLITQLIDGVAGLLAVLLALGCSEIRAVSTTVGSQFPVLVAAMAMLLFWLRWRRTRRWGDAALIGAAAGLAAITRPVDAICFAMPVGLAMLADLWRGKPKDWASALLPLVLAALPFLLFQGYFNSRVTGSWLKTPQQFYSERDEPFEGFGLPKIEPGYHTQSTLQQKQDHYERYLLPLAKGRLRTTYWRQLLNVELLHTLNACLPQELLLILLPVGVLGLIDRRRWPVAMSFALFALIYASHIGFNMRYTVVCLPAILLLLLLGADTIARAVPAVVRPMCSVFLTAMLAAIAICLLPEFDRLNTETFIDHDQQLTAIRNKLAALPHTPAVVLFHYAWDERDDTLLQREPVYNVDFANIDDAPIIRAHDLGWEKDQELIRYYAQHEPGRYFYLYDRPTGVLTSLGTAAELAAHPTTEPITHPQITRPE